MHYGAHHISWTRDESSAAVMEQNREVSVHVFRCQLDLLLTHMQWSSNIPVAELYFGVRIGASEPGLSSRRLFGGVLVIEYQASSLNPKRVLRCGMQRKGVAKATCEES